MPKTGYGFFGPVYEGYENRPREAIRLLRRVKQGECPRALYRHDIGYVDIVWGENDPKTNKGYGLKHIIEKHEREIKSLGFNIDDFILLSFYNGIVTKKYKDRIVLSTNISIMIIKLYWNQKKKKFILSNYDLSHKKTYPKKGR